MFEYFTGSKVGHSPSDLGGLLDSVFLKFSLSPISLTADTDNYICFCSRPFLFHGNGSLHSVAPSKEHDTQQHPAVMQQQSSTTPAVVDLTRSREWEMKLQQHLRQAQDGSAQQPAHTSTEFSPRSTFPNAAPSTSLQAAAETRHVGTSTSAGAVFKFADMLDRFACAAIVPRGIRIFVLSFSCMPHIIFYVHTI